MSSPGSQGNGESWTRDPSPSPLSGLGKVTVEEKTEDADVTQGQGAKSEDVTAAGRGMEHEENRVDKPTNSFRENFTHDISKVASQEEAGGNSVLEIASAAVSVKPVGSSVSKVVISDKNEQVESSTDSDSVHQKSDENEEKRRLEEAKEGDSPGSAAETSKDISSVKGSEVPECSDDKVPFRFSSLIIYLSSFFSFLNLLDIYAESFAFWSTSCPNLVVELLRFV